jgi:hypothetical protein
MRDVASPEQAASEKAAQARQAPARGGAAAPPPTEAAPAAGACARDHTSALTASEGPATMRDVGAGVALFVAMRFVLPRLLRRL